MPDNHLGNCEIEYVAACPDQSLPCGKQAVSRCVDCGSAICPDCRYECCGDSFCVACYDYHQVAREQHRIAAGLAMLNEITRAPLDFWFGVALGLMPDVQNRQLPPKLGNPRGFIFRPLSCHLWPRQESATPLEDQHAPGF
jgi:hypothetical protein